VDKGWKASIAAVSLLLFTSLAAACTTSVDSVKYKSNSEFFDGEVLQAGYVSNFATDEIDVYLGSSEIESRTGATVEEDLTLSVGSNVVSLVPRLNRIQLS